MADYNDFVRDLVVHNELAEAGAVDKAFKMLKLSPGKTLFDLLVERGLIEAEHEADILAMWEEHQVEASAGATPDELLADLFDGEVIDCSGYELETLHDYLSFTRSIGGSDLHIAAEAFPLVRIYGKLMPLNIGVQHAEDTERILFGALDEMQKNVLTTEFNLEFCLKEDGNRYRTTMVKQRLGWNGAFRVIPNKVPTLDELGLPSVLTKLTEYHQGLILVTGPNGSGKTSTLAAMIQYINSTRDEHIISIEDPIEFVFESDRSHINQREAGNHTESFSRALRASLREDPDIILIGDMRDRETTSLAITAAETGHLVFASLHTTSAPRTIDRLLDVFPPEEQDQVRTQIAESIKGIISQQLIPRADGDGMALALEILFNTPACMANIKDRKMHQIPSVMQMGAAQGMRLLDVSLQELVERRVISGEDAYFAAEDKERFERYAPKH